MFSRSGLVTVHTHLYGMRIAFFLHAAHRFLRSAHASLEFVRLNGDHASVNSALRYLHAPQRSSPPSELPIRVAESAVITRNVGPES